MSRPSCCGQGQFSIFHYIQESRRLPGSRLGRRNKARQATGGRKEVDKSVVLVQIIRRAELGVVSLKRKETVEKKPKQSDFLSVTEFPTHSPPCLLNLSVSV